MPKVIAVCCADLHLSHAPPAARSAEPDWYAAMARPLQQLGDLACEYRVPILFAGDLFDRWGVSPELINWAMDNLPHDMYCIAGQHDMPNHDAGSMERSAFQTLVKSERIRQFAGEDCQAVYNELMGRFWVSAFPWSFPIEYAEHAEHEEWEEQDLSIAVAHSFIWTKDQAYPGAPTDQRLTAYRDRLKGYDVAIFGDNHHGFTAKVNGCTVYNCGCLIPRKSNERHLKPAVGLIYDDGKVERRCLDTSEDVWLDEAAAEEVEEVPEGMAKFLEELKGLDTCSLDFRDAVLAHLRDEGDNIVHEVRKVLLDAMGE